MTRKVILHKAAEEEIYQAFAWYAERSEIAAHASVQELSSMMRLASNSPEMWPSVLETHDASCSLDFRLIWCFA